MGVFTLDFCRREDAIGLVFLDIFPRAKAVIASLDVSFYLSIQHRQARHALLTGSLHADGTGLDSLYQVRLLSALRSGTIISVHHI